MGTLPDVLQNIRHFPPLRGREKSSVAAFLVRPASRVERSVWSGAPDPFTPANSMDRMSHTNNMVYKRFEASARRSPSLSTWWGRRRRTSSFLKAVNGCVICLSKDPEVVHHPHQGQNDTHVGIRSAAAHISWNRSLLSAPRTKEHHHHQGNREKKSQGNPMRDPTSKWHSTSKETQQEGKQFGRGHGQRRKQTCYL